MTNAHLHLINRQTNAPTSANPHNRQLLTQSTVQSRNHKGTQATQTPYSTT